MSTVLITGAGKRLGRAMAIHLSQRGFNIAIHYNSSQKEALEVRDICIKNGVKSEIFKYDLSRYRGAESLIESVYKRFRDLEILINSASVFIRSHTKETDIETFENNLNINFSSPFFLTKGFTSLVSKGSIINILDTKVSFYHDAYSSYSISKKMLYEFTKLSALEFAPNIRVNGIAPGTILPPNGVDEEYMERLLNKVPLKRKGEVEDILKSVDFLIESTFITGQTIFVDGGENIKGY